MDRAPTNAVERLAHALRVAGVSAHVGEGVTVKLSDADATELAALILAGAMARSVVKHGIKMLFPGG